MPPGDVGAPLFSRLFVMDRVYVSCSWIVSIVERAAFVVVGRGTGPHEGCVHARGRPTTSVHLRGAFPLSYTTSHPDPYTTGHYATSQDTTLHHVQIPILHDIALHHTTLN